MNVITLLFYFICYAILFHLLNNSAFRSGLVDDHAVEKLECQCREEPININLLFAPLFQMALQTQARQFNHIIAALGDYLVNLNVQSLPCLLKLRLDSVKLITL